MSSLDAEELEFLRHYGFGKSRDYLVRNPTNGELCDSKAIAGAAYGYVDLPKEHSGQMISQVAKPRLFRSSRASVSKSSRWARTGPSTK